MSDSCQSDGSNNVMNTPSPFAFPVNVIIHYIRVAATMHEALRCYLYKVTVVGHASCVAIFSR